MNGPDVCRAHALASSMVVLGSLSPVRTEIGQFTVTSGGQL